MSYLANIQDSYGNVVLKNSGTLLQFGGTTNTSPAIQANGTTLQITLADGSALTTLQAENMVAQNVTVNGTLTANGFTPEGNIVIGDAYHFGFTGQTNISSNADGNLLLSNHAGNNFGFLQFGDTTSASPAFVKVGANLNLSLADGSNLTSLNLLNLSAYGTLALQENATPSPIANFGQLYAKNDGYLYYLTPAGTEYEVIPEAAAGITQLTGDVTAIGPGSAAATVVSAGGGLGGFSAATLTINSNFGSSQSTTLSSNGDISGVQKTWLLPSTNGTVGQVLTIQNAVGNNLSLEWNTQSTFSGSLSGDVTGTQSATVVSMVDGYTAAQVGSAVNTVELATNLDTPSTLVLRDSSGNFSANVITANIAGNVSGSAASFTGNLLGDVTGTQSATVVSMVDGYTAAQIGSVVGNLLSNQAAATFLGGPVSGSGEAEFRALQATDIPTISYTQVSGLAPSATIDTTNASNIVDGYLALNLLAQDSATNGQVMSWNGTQWAPYTISADISGSGTAGQITYWNGTNSITSSSDLTFDGTNLNNIGTGISPTNSIGSNIINLVSSGPGNPAISLEANMLFGSYSLKFPFNNATGYLQNDGSGQLSWNNTVVDSDGSGTQYAVPYWSSTTNELTTDTSITTNGDGYLTAVSFAAPLLSVIDQQTSAVGPSFISNTGAAPYNINLPMADGTAGQVLTTDGNSDWSWSTPVQTLSGDVTGAISGSNIATTVAYVDSYTAAQIGSAYVATSSATNLDTPSTLVLRDASGNFSAGVITANITGNVSGSAASFTGNLSGDVTGTQGATVVSMVDGYTAAQVGSAVNAVELASSSNTSSTLVLRDSSGNFAASKITSTVTNTGSVLAGIETITSNYTIDTNKPDYTILGNATSGQIILTLVSASGNAGRLLVVKKVDSSVNIISINPVGGQTIDGQASQQLSTQYESLTLQSDGSNWFLV